MKTKFSPSLNLVCDVKVIYLYKSVVDWQDMTDSQTKEFYTNKPPIGKKRVFGKLEWEADPNYIPPPSPIESCKCSLAEIRWDKQNLGVTIDGVFLLTDDKSKYEMGNYVLEKTNNGLLTVNWQLSDGTVKKYPMAEFIKCYNIIVNYINDCFGVVADKHIEIDTAADPTTVPLETGWPSREFTTV